MSLSLDDEKKDKQIWEYDKDIESPINKIRRIHSPDPTGDLDNYGLPLASLLLQPLHSDLAFLEGPAYASTTVFSSLQCLLSRRSW